MAEISLRPAAKPTTRQSAVAASRLNFVDHLRAALVILVVLHHVGLVYGAGAPFYYVEPPLSNPLTYLLLLAFALFNQAWFMGALFLLAGYFTPGSFDRKGAGAFLKGRLLRLGVPLLVFYFVLSPISAVGYWQMPASLTGITTPLTWQTYPFILGMGPLWFVALLLIFDFGYVVWRRIRGERTSAATTETPFPGYLALGLFIVVLALVSYLVRMVIPMGREVLDFPTLAYLPQYLSFFVLGAMASGRDWLRRVPRSLGVVGLIVALVATVLLFPLALSGSLFSLEIAEPAVFVGDGSWQSAAYALWDSIFAVGVGLAAIVFFRRYFDGDSGFGRFLSQHSYAVYIIHIPIVVFIGIALKGVVWHPLLKFGAAALVAVPICFLVAYLVRRLPLASRIL